MGKARNSLDPRKPQFSQVELCEVAEIPMATANNWRAPGAEASTENGGTGHAEPFGGAVDPQSPLRLETGRPATRETIAAPLAALRAMFTKNRTEISSEQAVQELLADPDSPWQEYRGRGPITKNQVAALLRDYDIRPVVLHPTKRADFSRHGYRAAHFEDAFARFLPHEPNIRTLKRGRDGM